MQVGMRHVVKAVIFDIDGTLLDSVDLHAEAWVRALNQYDIQADFRTVRSQIGKGADQLLPALVPTDTSKERKREIAQFRARLFKDEYLERVRAFPRVRELFQRIRSDDTKIVLASSCSRDEIGHYEKIAHIDDLIDFEATSDDASSSKPSPDIFIKALEYIAPVTAAEAVVVGDTRYDGEAARKAGIPFVGMLSGGFPESELRETGCIAVYRSPADLLENYDTSPLRSTA
jgi:HAD superfamily hydrolase (TIGR01549 family)